MIIYFKKYELCLAETMLDLIQSNAAFSREDPVPAVQELRRNAGEFDV